MGRVVAISGGDLQTTEALNTYAQNLTGKSNPNVLFIGTASMDNDGYYDRFVSAFQNLVVM